jgi:phosphonate transport system substrate-binding protein
VRTFDSAEVRARLGDACELLSRALGVVVFPQLSVSYRELAESLDRGALGFAWMPPILAIELEERKRIVPVALPVRRGSTSFHAAILGRRGVVKTLDDLRGKRAVWVDRESAAGYAVPRMHLVSSGFDVRTLFASETFVHSHSAVIDALVAGRADVGASFCGIDPASQRVIHASWTARDGTAAKAVDAVAFIGPIPNDAIVAAADVPEDLRSALLATLTAPDPKLRTALDAVLRADGYRAASSAHYEPLRRMIAAAKERGDSPISSRR